MFHYNEKMYNLINNNKELTISILNIERNKKRPRKDISSYSDFESLFIYMYDEYFYKLNEKMELIKEYKNILLNFVESYNTNLDEQEWFEMVKSIGVKYNYASSVKEYNENPEKYNGNITDVCTLIRFAITNRLESPNIYEILKVLGMKKVNERINYFIQNQE